MQRIWDKYDRRLIKGGFWYLGLTILWILITVGLNRFFTGTTSDCDLTILLQSKILLVAIVFLERYLFFITYRTVDNFKWIYILVFLLMIGINFGKLIAKIDWFFLGMFIADTAFWCYFIAVFLDTLWGLVRFWQLLPKLNPANFQELWNRFWKEEWQLGIVLTLVAGLFYYDLVSFYLVNQVVYSFIFLVPLLAASIGFYALFITKLKSWITQDVQTIDEGLRDYLHWQSEDAEVLNSRLPVYQYLLLTRDYLVKLKRPIWSVKVLILYLILSGFIVVLPYIFGIAVEVNSFH